MRIRITQRKVAPAGNGAVRIRVIGKNRPAALARRGVTLPARARRLLPR